MAGGPQNISVLDVASGDTLATLKGPQGSQAFLNGLVTTASGHVYVTDSFRPIVLRTSLAGMPAGALETWLDLSTTPVRYVPNRINLNGIVASADGRHLPTILNEQNLWLRLPWQPFSWRRNRHPMRWPNLLDYRLSPGG